MIIIQEENRPYTRGRAYCQCGKCGKGFYTLADEMDDKCLPCHLVEVEEEEKG